MVINATTKHGGQNATGTNRRQSNADHEHHPLLRLRGGWYVDGWFGRIRFAWDRHLLLQWRAGGGAPHSRRCGALTAWWDVISEKVVCKAIMYLRICAASLLA